MTWLSILFYILLNLPKLIGIIRELIGIIRGLPKDQQVFWKEKMAHAIKHHKETGDLTEIVKVCEGVGCVSTIKDNA